MTSLSGRVAVITGSARNIGRATALMLAREGAAIMVHARTDAAGVAETQRIIEAAGGAADGHLADVSTEAGAQSLIAATVARFGKVDIVVNNAGISHAKPFETVTDEDWQGDLDLKLFAAIRTIRAVLPGMRQRKWGRIVNVLNIGAKAPNANSAPTSVSRAAGMALTKALSHENAPHGVLVNAMLVGLIESDQWVRRHKTAAGEGKTYEEFIAGMAKGRIPLGRMGKAEEFARMACFLCSDAGSFITGVAINVDGGASPVV
jgi:NAD(P)-dependent dehydrogenase (short-subunit alcohol dehydrogenase family)